MASSIVTFEPTETLDLLGTGTQRIYKFDNGFGASVIRGDYSYGGSEGLFELGVLDAADNLTYETPITDDVIGWLQESDVQNLLVKIAAL